MKKIFEKSAILLLALVSVLSMGALTSCSKDGGPGQQNIRPTAAIQGTWGAKSECQRFYTKVDGKWTPSEDAGKRELAFGVKQMEIYSNGWAVMFECGMNRFDKFVTRSEFHGAFSKVEENFYDSDEVYELSWFLGIHQVSDDMVEVWNYKPESENMIWVDVTVYKRSPLVARFAQEVEQALSGYYLRPVYKATEVLLLDAGLWVKDESASKGETPGNFVYKIKENGQGEIYTEGELVGSFGWEQDINRVRIKKADGTVAETFIDTIIKSDNESQISFTNRTATADRVEKVTYIFTRAEPE